jgi:hypothetical protein
MWKLQDFQAQHSSKHLDNLEKEQSLKLRRHLGFADDGEHHHSSEECSADYSFHLKPSNGVVSSTGKNFSSLSQTCEKDIVRPQFM